MKKFFIFLFLIFSILISSVVWAKVAITPEDWNNGYVIVKKGWTLSEIAYVIFGDYQKYKLLAEMNGIENPNIIRIGQKIIFRKKKLISRSEAKEMLDNLIYERINLFRKPIYLNSEKARESFEYNIELISSLHLTESKVVNDVILKLMKRAKKAMFDYDALIIREQFTDALFKTLSDLEGKEILDFGLWMMSLLEVESGYKNQRGQHGELGWYQVKPKTWLFYTKILYGMDVLPQSNFMEENFFVATKWEAKFLKYLLNKNNNSWLLVLQKYNAGSSKFFYSQKVYQRYRTLKKKLFN